MKRPLLVALLTFLLLNLALSASAAPLAQGPKPVITQPEADAGVRGTVQIVGSATHPQFQRYELYYAPFPVPGDNAWVFIGDAHFQQQPAGLLGTWATGGLPDGAYGLKVRVVRQDGNYTDSDVRRVLVVNKRPVETPTPLVSPTPVEAGQPTQAPAAAPTVAAIVPTVQLRTTVTPTLQTKGATTPTPPAASAQPTLASAGASLIDTGRLIDTAKTAAKYTVGLFLAIAAFFAVKAILAWLWHKIRP